MEQENATISIIIQSPINQGMKKMEQSKTTPLLNKTSNVILF